MALYSGLGHEVVAIYLTKGERGISGKSLEESAEIRTKEAIEACKRLQAKPVFVGQVDGECEINIEQSYPKNHGMMEVFRGMEYRCGFAEAYIKHAQSKAILLPS
jgi:LmbE family N-acetylglucosaminyl deacetylase